MGFIQTKELERCPYCGGCADITFDMIKTIKNILLSVFRIVVVCVKWQGYSSPVIRRRRKQNDEIQELLK